MFVVLALRVGPALDKELGRDGQGLVLGKPNLRKVPEGQLLDRMTGRTDLLVDQITALQLGAVVLAEHAVERPVPRLRFLVPFLDTSKVRSTKYRPVFRQFFFIFLINAVILGFVGANKPEGTWLVIGRLATAYYFIHFLVILPFVGWFERPKPLPESISTPVLKDTAGGGAAIPEPAE